ncbi:MAG: hypothetical protein PWQ70_2405 [Clostridiales bacterium]|jgi:hypothetical protein|nr:hypothetical protein [Clostridiales bacterium]
MKKSALLHLYIFVLILLIFIYGLYLSVMISVYSDEYIGGKKVKLIVNIIEIDHSLLFTHSVSADLQGHFDCIKKSLRILNFFLLIISIGFICQEIIIDIRRKIANITTVYFHGSKYKDGHFFT